MVIKELVSYVLNIWDRGIFKILFVMESRYTERRRDREEDLPSFNSLPKWPQHLCIELEPDPEASTNCGY